jgi:hypothetical protein
MIYTFLKALYRFYSRLKSASDLVSLSAVYLTVLLLISAEFELPKFRETRNDDIDILYVQYR